MADVQSREGKPYGPFSFLLLSVLVGVVSGLCAVAFRGFIAFFHNLFFLGRLSFFYDANIHTPASPWGAFVVLVPAAGAVGVAFLVKNFAPEAKGTGVPEVMNAIHYRKGVIRPVVALVKSLASALSIGSGGSVGREGPIMQIGSALASLLFIRSVYSFEDFFHKRVKGGYYAQHMTGMLLVGVIMYLLMTSYGHYYVEGVGYSTIQEVLSGKLFPLYFLLLLFALKLLTTSLTLGSGGSGGIFSPTLFLGATLGGAYGMALHVLLPGHAVSPSSFAVAGMAGLLGGTTGAAMTSIVMIFEMTLDYSVILPMTISVAISYGVRSCFPRTAFTP
jgi:H+/Cl- antiporter ClcA